MLMKRAGIARINYCRIAHEGDIAVELRRVEQVTSECSTKFYAALIQRCRDARDLSDGKLVHDHIVKNGFAHDRYLSNHLVEMYAKSGEIDAANAIFSAMRSRNAFSWTIMIVAFAQTGNFREAFELFRRMDQDGTTPTTVTFVTMLGVCAGMGDLAQGRALHARITSCCLESNTVVKNNLVNMYAKCGSLKDAREVLSRMGLTDVIGWTAMLTAYAQKGDHQEALLLFWQMQLEGIEPNQVTFTSLAEACAVMGNPKQAEKVQHLIVERGIPIDAVLGTALMLMHGKCSRVAEARNVFDSIKSKSNFVVWNTMISVYAQQGYSREALDLFHIMEIESKDRNEVTFTRVLAACCSPGYLADGRLIHQKILALEFDRNAVVGTSLVTMYVNCGSFHDAIRVFESTQARDSVSWTAMMAAYVEHEQGKEALGLFFRMCLEGVEINRFTLATALEACAIMGALKDGKHILGLVEKLGLEIDVVLASVIIILYGRCSRIDEARKTFDRFSKRDIVCCNAMIIIYAQHGHYNRAVDLFRQSNIEGIVQNNITFLCMLFGCNHAGSLEEGWRCFISMSGDYGISPAQEHFRCIVDLLARAGRIEQAEEVINSMPFPPVRSALMTLVGACRIQKDKYRGAKFAQRMLELDTKNAASYVMLSNIYA